MQTAMAGTTRAPAADRNGDRPGQVVGLDLVRRSRWMLIAREPGEQLNSVGLSNHRLRAIDDEHVTFVGRHDKRVTLTHHEFIRRFLVHVLPPGFVRLRHYGLLAPCNATTVLDSARELLGQPPPEPLDDITWRERFFQLTGVDLRRCTHCRHRTVERVAHFGAAPQTTAPDFLDSS